jgi:hypothetical protein
VHSHRLTTLKLGKSITEDVSSTLELHLTTTTVSDVQQCDTIMAFPNTFSVSRAPKSSLWSKTWCQRYSCVESRSMPVREQYLDTAFSSDQDQASSIIGIFRML